MLLFLAACGALALLPLGLKVHRALFFGLIQAVDNLVLAFLDVKAFHEPVVVKGHGAYGHVARFLRKRSGPTLTLAWGVYMIVTLFFLLPSMELALTSCEQSSKSASGMAVHSMPSGMRRYTWADESSCKLVTAYLIDMEPYILQSAMSWAYLGEAMPD